MIVQCLPSGAWWVALCLAYCSVCATGANPQGGISLFLAAAPVPKERMDSLAGTTWSGPDSDGDDYVYTFEMDGTLSYKSPTGSYKNGTWKQFGNAVYFETNNRYSEHLGEISGKTMKGRAWNTASHAWTWKATLDK